MRCRLAVIYWIVNDREHSALSELDKQVENLLPFLRPCFRESATAT